MTGLLELAERVERYTPSGRHDIDRDKERSFNEAIAVAIGMPLTVEVGHELTGNLRRVPNRLPQFVTSLDAAMTLVPDEFERPAAVQFQRTRNFGCTAVVWTNSEFNRSVRGDAKAMPLAMCAAALRARATPNESSPI